MTKDEALKLGLEALEGFIPYLPLKDEAQCNRYDKAIAAVKETQAQPERDYERGFIDGMQKQMQSSVDKAVNRMAQPEQEFVAWEQFYPDIGKIAFNAEVIRYVAPQRTWVGLTDEDLKLLSAEWRIVYGAWMDDFALDIEAKLKEKNT